MVDLSQISTLLGGSAATDKTATTLVGGLLNQSDDLAAITKTVLSSKFNLTDVEDTVSFSQELQDFITNNVKDSAQAEKLLADIAAIDNLNEKSVSNSDATGQLLGTNTGSNANEAGNILDLLA